MPTTVYFKGTRTQVRQVLASAVSIAVGHSPDPTGTVSGMYKLLGMTALNFIKDAFVTKADGGVDEAGDSWAPLSPKTVAYSRKWPELTAKRKLRPGRPLLTSDQDQLWRKIFATNFHWLLGKGTTEKEAKAIAAANAWIRVKAEGGKTIIGEFGQRKVQILRDTGGLLNSLSPGEPDGARPENQIFKIGNGEVIVGTNYPGSTAHHSGIPGRLPQRRLWPDPAKWPNHWWYALADAGRHGIVNVIIKLLAA